MSGSELQISIGRARRGLSSPLPGQAYVGRPSPLGNPYALGRDGNREEVIGKYRRWLWQQLQLPGSPNEHELRSLLAQADPAIWCYAAPFVKRLKTEPALSFQSLDTLLVPCGDGAECVVAVISKSADENRFFHLIGLATISTTDR